MKFFNTKTFSTKMSHIENYNLLQYPVLQLGQLLYKMGIQKVWYYLKYYTLIDQSDQYLHFFVSTVSKGNTNLISQCEAPHTWLLQEHCRDAAIHFSNLGGAEGRALFLRQQYEKLHAVTALYCQQNSRIVKRRCFNSCFHVGQCMWWRNGSDEYVCKTTEARHELACAVLLCSTTSLWLRVQPHIQVFSPQHLQLPVP